MFGHQRSGADSMDGEENPNIYFKAGEAFLARVPLSMVVTDPNADDNPIVYVNRAFEQLTGYAASYAIGRNCRFLQGTDRSQAEVQKITAALESGEAVSVRLRNYRADGSAFENLLTIAPVQDADGTIRAFLGIQSEVVDLVPGATARVEPFGDRLQEMQHRVKNHLAMIASLTRMQEKEDSGRGGFAMLARRIDALSLLYDEFQAPPRSEDVRYDVVSAGGYVSRVAATIGALDGRRNVRMTVDVDTVYMRSERAAQLGLLVSEILSNTLQHAFQGRSEGLVHVSLKQGGGDRVRLIVSDDGVGMSSNWPEEGNLGARITRSLVRQLDAKINVGTGDNGSVVTLDLDNALDTSLERDGRRVLADSDGSRAGNEAQSILEAARHDTGDPTRMLRDGDGRKEG
jgi:PAS domain S-box-containing protein